MYTHNKDYTAVYFQLYKPNDIDVDSNDINMAIRMMAQNYSREELEKMSEKQRMDKTMDYVSSIWAEKVSKREVHVRINNNREEYRIQIIYDNLWNMNSVY